MSARSRAVMAERLGPPENYRLVEQDLAMPGPGEVQVAIRAVGVSYADTLIASGRYQVVPSEPFIPGTECAGVVEALGVGVTNLRLGQPVVARAFGGLFAERVNLPQSAVGAFPSDLDFDHAAVLSASYATAWHALGDRGRLQKGENLLVLGAGGATGYAAVQVGKVMGARVIASASTVAKRALALTGGADVAIDSTSATWRDNVRQESMGRSIDVVFDPVGGSATELGFRTLGWGGRHLVIGFVAGLTALRTNLALIKGAALVGVDVRQFEKYEPKLYASNLDMIFGLAAQSKVSPAIAQSLPLTSFQEAMVLVTAGDHVGRIVLRPD